MENINYVKSDGDLISLQVYSGKMTDLMPKFKLINKEVLDINGIGNQRIQTYKLRDEKLVEMWNKYYYDCADTIAYSKTGGIKIVYKSPNLTKLNSNTKLINGAINLEKNIEMTPFEQLDESCKNIQLYFSNKDVEYFSGKMESGRNIKKNLIWKALFRGNQDLLEEYIEETLFRTKNTQIMRIFLSKKVPEFDCENMLTFSGLNAKSSVYGDLTGRLDYVRTRIIGR